MVARRTSWAELTIALLGLVSSVLAQAEFHASSKGLSIVGYYQGNERLDDTAFSITGTKVADKIKSRFPGAFAIVVSPASHSLHQKVMFQD